MARTLTQLIQDVLRETRGQCNRYEAQQALQDAINFIDATANWEFLLKTRLINLHASVSTGTVSCAVGTTAVTLSGSTWATALSPFGEYREIKFGDRQLPYKVAQVNTSTSLTLLTALSGDTISVTDIVNGTYVLYQARYPLPVDCEPGRDLALKGPISTGMDGSGTIDKLEAMTHERHVSDQIGGGLPDHYTDDEFDDTNHAGTIRIWPYPTRPYEFRLSYYRKLTIPTTAGESLMIPEAFERAPILMASSNIMRKKGGQGWLQLRQEATELLQKLYNRHAVSPAYKGSINPSLGGSEPDDIFGIDGFMYTRGIV